MDHHLISLVEDGQDSHTLIYSSPNKVYDRYAMERTPTFIKVWFWSRQDPSVPSDVLTTSQDCIDTNLWGTPVALFPNTGCDVSSKFGAHNVIINLTFCELNSALVACQLRLKCQGGDWAGQTFTSSGCPGTCAGMHSLHSRREWNTHFNSIFASPV